jgi:hypothetical protein
MEIRVVSSLGLLQIKLPWTLEDTFLCGQLSLFFLGKDLGGMAGSYDQLAFNILRDPQVVLQRNCPIFIPTIRVWEFWFPHIFTDSWDGQSF